MDARSAPTPQRGGQIRLGRIFGMRIGLDLSWFLIAALVTWYIYHALTTEGAPDFPPVTRWVVAIVTALAFFVCLLAHEMGHSLIARRHGVEVSGITLHLFGGVAMLKGDLKDPRAELRIAVAGPLVSLAVWFLAFWTHWVFGPYMPEVVRFPLGWLAQINLILLIFNMLPGFPMDGGRVLRALLWWRSRNMLRATRRAAMIGRGFGLVLIGLAVWSVINVTAVGRPELVLPAAFPALLGMFLRKMASVEEQQVALRAGLEGLAVRDAMRAPAAVPSWTPVADAVNRYLIPLGAAELPVEYYGQLMGTISLGQVRTVPWPDAAHLTVYHVMRPLAPEDTIAPDVAVWDVLVGLVARRRESALVIENDRLVGMLLLRDLLQMAQMRAHMVAGAA